MGPRGQLAGRRRNEGEGFSKFASKDEKERKDNAASTEVASQQERGKERMGILRSRPNHRLRVTLRRGGDALRLAHLTTT